jgi:GNAT superfamily N-acetyltransferase
MNINLRRARPEDREKAIWVESLSTPNLSYLPYVFDMFVADEEGDFSVAEIDNEIVGTGKYTIVPDGSAWLETLRVVPARQNLGVGKRFYEHWLDIAHHHGVKTMRMYTGVENVASEGLAKRFGLTLAGRFRGATYQCQPLILPEKPFFQLVNDPDKAVSLLMPLREKWGGFMVMNRTFYSFTPTLCANLAEKKMVYEDSTSNSVIALGARFMPEQALHIGAFGGDATTCINFALEKCAKQRIGRLSCLFPPTATETQATLLKHGFRLDKSDYIVMEIDLDK